jgi:hypothetical protein
MTKFNSDRLKNRPYFNNDGWWVSPFNFVDEVSSEYKGKTVAIHDVTLRDGEQTFGVAFSPEERDAARVTGYPERYQRSRETQSPG